MEYLQVIIAQLLDSCASYVLILLILIAAAGAIAIVIRSMP